MVTLGAMLSLTPATRSPTRSPPCSDIARHAVELRDRGFTVIHNSGLDATLVAAARTACSAEFERLQDMIVRLGLDPVEDSYAFEEIDKRHRNRWSFQPPPSALAPLVDMSVPLATRVIRTLHTLEPHPDDAGLAPAWAEPLLPAQPVVRHVGAITSRPGAAAQKFHADAGDRLLKLGQLHRRHRMFNIFIPLVELAEGGTGTMMWPGSHLARTRAAAYQAAIERSGTLEADEAVMAEMEVPGCQAGGIILFDFRLLHRGQPNDTNDERTLVHAFLSTGFATDGTITHKPGSLSAALDALPHDPLARSKATARMAATQREAWLRFRTHSAN